MIAEERELSMDERVIAFREATDDVERAVQMLRSATLKLVDADLVGALDLVSPQLYSASRVRTALEIQLAVFSVEAGNEPRIPGTLRASRQERLKSHSRRLGRRVGVDVVPGSVKKARAEAGLSLAEVAGDQVTRVAIWYVETGKTRPSIETLRLIARRTGKPLDFFTGNATRVHP